MVYWVPMSYFDPQLLRIAVIDGDEASLRNAAICATAQVSHPTATAIHTLLKPFSPLRHQPVQVGEKDAVVWSRWHSGAETAFFTVGDASLLERCELTDTERERLMLTIRKAATHQEHVYAVAAKQEKPGLRGLPRELECLGLIFYR